MIARDDRPVTTEATTEELRAKIAAARERRRQEDERTLQLLREVEQAKQRQDLRRELDSIEWGIKKQTTINAYHNGCRESIDSDEIPSFWHNPEFSGKGGKDGKGSNKGGKNNEGVLSTTKFVGAALHCSKPVKKGSFTWDIHGMSWLASALKQDFDSFVKSGSFDVGTETFDLVYNPAGGAVGVKFVDEYCDEEKWTQTGSLAIRHKINQGVTFRHRFFVRDADGEFQQWGEEGDECHPDWDDAFKAFGPDVQSVLDGRPPERPIGIFGLSHKQLLQSKWIQGDSLFVKVEVEVRDPVPLYCHRKHIPVCASVEVPPNTLDADMLNLFTSGKQSDVTFVVDGERIKAHAGILCARSEVFDRLLLSGMHETVSKEVAIADCDSATMKMLLKFLYTDSLNFVAADLEMMAPPPVPGTSVDMRLGDCASTSLREAGLQSLLAASHKYQVVRLQRWCEQQLCECISVNNVCSILCLAHLHSADSLERSCMAFFKEKFHKVVRTSGFGVLVDTWPEVMLKVNLNIAGVSENDAASAMEAQLETCRKRQRRS